MGELLKRKADLFLEEWHRDKNKKPLIVQGARQVGKTETIRQFAKKHYKNFIEINFVIEEKYKVIFDDGYTPDAIIKNISLLNQDFKFEAGETLIFFDEIQVCAKGATSLKFFKQDGRFDVICSGSLMGINYQEIESVSVGYKTDYQMNSLDFEEFLWAKGYGDEQIQDLYSCMKNLTPLSKIQMEVMNENFHEYLVLGGMPEVVAKFVSQKNFSGTLDLQKQLLRDYEEDITKYAKGLEKGKILSVYRHIPIFLAKENKKYQISKIEKNARSRDYIGCVEWLKNAGIINVCYCMDFPELPLKGNYNDSKYKIYYRDTGLLIASLEEEAQEDLRKNKNYNVYKGAVYENLVADCLFKEGYELLYYKKENSQLEMDFFVRDKDSLIPLEVKAKDGATKSLNMLIDGEHYPEIKYGIKLGYKNIGFNGKFYTFPYFLAFLLKRFLREKK